MRGGVQPSARVPNVTAKRFVGSHTGNTTGMSVWTGQFRGGALAARRVRHAVREQLGGKLSERQLGDVELLVSELATNSVRHGGCGDANEISLEAAVDERRVRVQLCDHGAGFPDATPERPPTGRAGGYGLVLLDRLSNRWGTQQNGGFCVWFEVERAGHA